MKSFEVGKLFEENKTHYQEGVKFDFTQSGPVLFLFFNRPTKNEIQSIKSGNGEVGMYVKDEVILMLFKFEGMQWMDAPYNIHLSAPFEFDVIEEGKGFGLTILLVDASTGILEVIKYIGLSTELSRKLQNAIQNQKLAQWDNVAYEKKINQIYDNYNTDDLVLRAEIIYKIRREK